MGVVVEVVGAVDGEVEAALERLLPQLSPGMAIPSRGALEAILGSGCVSLLVARADGAIVGMLALTVVRVPTGVRAYIDDVCVDEAARGAGIGEELTRAALRLARERGAGTVDLTSRPERTAANRLYVRLGFDRRDTNVYRYDLMK